MELPQITPQAISTLNVPSLLIIGDSDIVTPEHAVRMFSRARARPLCPSRRLLGRVPAPCALSMLVAADAGRFRRQL